MIEGLVSTVIPVYNRPAMLREAVTSVLAQTWRPIEIIIVDDGSTDDTLQVADALRQQHPDEIRVIAQRNAGPGRARQTGLEAAQGEFVQFLDSDDLLLPEKFSMQVQGLRDDPPAGISFGKCHTRINGERLPSPAQRTGEPQRQLFPALLAEPLWPTLVPLYRHAVLREIGPWPDRKQLEDWQYDAQAGALRIPLHYVDAYIAETREHDEARLCRLWQQDIGAMKDRVAAYFKLHECALRAGVLQESPEMQRFSRSLFWMARTAGAQGLVHEAEQLFQLARATALHPGWDFRLFGWARRWLGWQRASRWAEALMGRRA